MGTTTCWIYQSIKSVQSGITAPDGSTTAFAFGTINAGGSYASIRQEQYGLKPGTTYTFSYFRNITLGVTGGSFRFRNITGSVATNDIQPAITFTGTGWQRYSHTFATQATQTALDSFILSRNNSASETAGVTVCLWGAQLEEGSTATGYSRSTGFRDSRGGCIGATGPIYDYDENKWLNYGVSNGIDYVSPLVNFYRISGWEIDNTSGWTQNSEMTRVINQLKYLPESKRSFQPTLFNRDDWFKLTGDKTGATGAESRKYYGNTYPFTSSNSSNFYPGPWNDNGISAGLSFYNQLLNILSASSVKLDYVFLDNESNYGQNFSIVPVTGGTTGWLRDSRYTQTWRGLSSWASQMSAAGVTISKISGPAVSQSNDKVAYLVWNNITKQYQATVLNEIVSKPTLSQYPNSIVSNYAYWNSGTGATAAAPDAFGHPQYQSAYVGNATSPVLYGEITQIDANVSPGNVVVNPNDPTSFILAVSGATGATLSKGPWTSFTIALQELRNVKRASPNIPITPWIGSVRYAGIPFYNVSSLAPTVGFADINKGYSSVMGYTTGMAGNSAYYYELVRHICLTGVKAIGYWNSSSFSVYEGVTETNERDYFAKGITQHVKDISLLNETLKEVNLNTGGYKLNTASSDRISWLAKQITSGTAKSWNNYIWRTTIKPGTIYEHTTTDNTNSILSGSCVGKWFNTTTSTPPDVRPLELKDVFYFPGVFSTDGSPFAHGTGTPYANWFGTNRSVVAAFQGDLYTSNEATTKVVNGRAYEFEMDPANPTVTSPWHNAIYENCIDPYIWGARSFTFFQPHGQIPQVAYPFNEVVRRAEGYYSSTTDASKSPARWKGFTSGVRALLEGKLNPAGACAAKTGFTAISEPCNVHVYLPSTNGYWEDRFGNTAAGPAGDTFYPGSLVFWDKCFTNSGGSTTAANNLYYASVNQWLTEFISMKSPSITAGVLSCSIDATTCSATPNTVGLFATLPAYYTRGNSYELTDWYISQTLRANNIPVYCEARPQKIFKLLNSGITSGEISNIPGLCGATAISQWTNHLCVEYNLWYTSPNNPVLPSPDINFAGAIPDSEVPSVMRYSQNSGPIPNDRDPYQIPLIVATGGTSYLLPYGFTSYLDSPQRALLDLYSANDVYRKFNNLANTGLTFKGVAYDYMTRGMLFTSYGDWARGSCGCKEINPTNNSGSLTGYYRPDTDNASEGNRIGYGPTQPRKFDRTAFIASTTNYANNAQGQSGYWTSSGISFWRANVKQPTFNGFLEMLKQVSLTGCPKYGNTAGWTGATYPNDFYGLGIFPKSMRP
jgi:hypothetical protein